jgi:hypothetical protein
MRVDFAYYPFKNLKPRRKWEGLQVDALEDMAANKAMALIDRHEPKDALDLYFLLKKTPLTLGRLARAVHKKFGVSVDQLTLLNYALIGSKSLGRIKPLLIGDGAEKNKLIDEVVAYFSKESAEVLRSRL